MRKKRKKEIQQEQQKLHFISAHFSLFNKFADKRADSAKQHAQNERLKTQTCPLDPNNSDNNAYTEILCRFPVAISICPASAPHTERKWN